MTHSRPARIFAALLVVLAPLAGCSSVPSGSSAAGASTRTADYGMPGNCYPGAQPSCRGL